MMSLMRGSLQGRRFGPRHANSSFRHLTDTSVKPVAKVKERETAIMIVLSLSLSLSVSLPL